MTLVKICGNQSAEDVVAAAAAGADLVGMIFARSERQVTIEQAQSMVRALGLPLAGHEMVLPPPAASHAREEVGSWFRHGAQVVAAYLGVKRPLTVGVFADQPIDEVNQIAWEVGLDLVQLSGDERWEDCLLVTKQVDPGRPRLAARFAVRSVLDRSARLCDRARAGFRPWPLPRRQRPALRLGGGPGDRRRDPDHADGRAQP